MAENKFENAPWVRLGDYIERSMVNNSDLKYGTEFIEGVNSNGEFCKTKADLLDINLKPYKLVNNGDFVYNPSRFNIGSIAYRTTGFCIVSHLYVVFRLNELGKEKINPLYLYMYIYRDEFFRMITYLNFGSQRPEFNFFELSDIKIPLPSIETQNEIVAVYNGLKELAEENEKLLEPLSKSCQAFIVDCKMKYPKKRLGDLIAIDEKINSENRNLEFLGINRDKTFMPSVATTEGLDKSKYKVISKGKFVFSGMQTGRDVCIRFGLYNETVDGLVSPAYTTYSIVDKNILPEYLLMNFKRSEMDRLGWFLSDTSVRSNLDFDRFHDIQIPIPPIQIQQKIVDLYNCYEECKRIAKEAREKISNLCPALVQKAAHSR